MLLDTSNIDRMLGTEPDEAATFQQFVRLLHGSDSATAELRILTNKWVFARDGRKVGKQIYGGVFNDLAKMYTEAIEYSGGELSPEEDGDTPPHITGCYIGINPPDLKQTIEVEIKDETYTLRVRVNNAVGMLTKRGSFRAVPDVLIARRTCLYIDIDSVHPVDESATNEEKLAAHEVGLRIIAWLKEQGIEVLAVVDSGNGMHAYLAVDLPNDNESEQLVERFLTVLDEKFTNDRAKIDCTVSNASRIARVPFTLAAKGSSTVVRPWRVARILHLAEQRSVVTAETLERIGAGAKKSGFTAKVGMVASKTEIKHRADKLVEFFHEFEIEMEGPDPKADGTYYYVTCPWADPNPASDDGRWVTPHGGATVDHHRSESNGTDVAVRVNGGGYSLCCQHSHKHDIHWKDFRKFHDPEGSFVFEEALTNEEIIACGERWGMPIDFVAVAPDDEVVEEEEQQVVEQTTLEVSEKEIVLRVHNEMHTTMTDKHGEEKEVLKKDRELRIDVVKTLYEALRSRGRGLFLDQNGRFLYHNPQTHRLVNLESHEFNERLFCWGLPKSDNRTAIVEGLMDLVAARQKQPVTVYPVWHYEPSMFCLYVNIANEKLCIITTDGWQLQPNGYKGIWVYSPGGGLPVDCIQYIQPWQGSGIEVTNTTLCNLVRMRYDVAQGITQRDMEQLFLIKMLTSCLPEMSRRKNLAAAISDRHASGKTFLFSFVGWLFEGESFAPTVVTQKRDSDQLESILTQRPILLADNIDKGSSMSQGLLCMAATSGKIQKRAHYKNFELAEATIMADVYMTGLQLPSAFKGDMYSRLLVFRLLTQEEDGLTETERERRFLKHRPEMLGEVLSRLQAVVRDEQRAAQLGKKYKTPFRIKDFGLFVLRQSDLYGQGAWAGTLLQRLTEEQMASSVETSSIEPVFDMIVGRYPGVYRGRKLNHVGLHKLMSQTHSERIDRNNRFYFEDSKSLKSYLMPNQELLQSRWGITREMYGNNPVWVINPTEQQSKEALTRLGVMYIGNDESIPVTVVMDDPFDMG